MLRDTPGKRLDRYIPDYVVFDLETTGISPNYDDVIEISAVKVNNKKVVDTFSMLVNPGRHIPIGASNINGITDDMVSNAPDFEKALKEFFIFIEDLVLVGHNINSFDMKFLYRDSRKYFNKIPDNDYIDTLYMARKRLPELRHHRLTDLSEYYGISTAGAHRALCDCTMNQQVFELLEEELSPDKMKKRNMKTCPKCGEIMKKRNGRYGDFWGCSGYPECRYTENIKEEQI